eukprot:scaffold159228_cov42-Prasinocladus_malaysianus.AAC.1
MDWLCWSRKREASGIVTDRDTWHCQTTAYTKSRLVDGLAIEIAAFAVTSNGSENRAAGYVLSTS